MAQAFYALGRTSEAVAAWEFAALLGHNFAKLFIGHANLMDKRDDIGIAQIDAFMQKYGYPDPNWVRERVTGS